jgi:ADP-ribose pyrophosphatase
MQTIIVGDGLTNDHLSLEHSFQDSKSNIGRFEINRLMGRGKAFGNGALPSFLRQAMEARSKGVGVAMVLLKSVGEPGGDATASDSSRSRASEFADPLGEIANAAVVIPSPATTIPWKELVSAFSNLTGADLPSKAAEGEPVRFLVVGSHTDRRVLTMASFLKNVLGFPEVAVSSHLVGSATQAAHFAALQHNLPSAGVRVFLDLEETAAYAGLDTGPFAQTPYRPCTIDPPDVRDALDPQQERIIQLLCMHWTKAQLRPLAGGYSGSLLFLADGWKGQARTEPMVLKVDDFTQMRHELDGYHQVKDFFGKHVPTFGYPITEGDKIGVGMELAAMEGNPRTLQDTFEEAEGEDAVQRFMLRLDKALALLSEKLYRNTTERSWVVPYRVFGLHAEKQLRYLRRNTDVILPYLEAEAGDVPKPDPEQLAKLIRLIAANEDGLVSEVCVVHGDLNYANVICDEGDNIWFIDWTHCDQFPVELDFAKLESDVKFVMSKEFDYHDLPRMKQFEEYLLSHRLPADSNSLPESLKFAKWDLRFRKILDAVRKIRQTCFDLKANDEWVVYRIALLSYALHNLSFDKRQGRGECEPPQLISALYSVEGLVFDLAADDFHLRIRAERPPSYPPRQRISIDESLWLLGCPDYDPPYHVDPSVLENDCAGKPEGWADPEAFERVKDEPRIVSTKYKDDKGRPLNPHGRTGIAGRGLLGRWGANASVAATVIRTGTNGSVEILLGGKEDGRDLMLPKGFVLPDETAEEAVGRVLEKETGWRPKGVKAEVVFEGYTYDPRQTDHAWVERQADLFHCDMDAAPGTFEPGGEFDEVKWWLLDADTVNRVPSGGARFIRETVKKLMETDRMEKSLAEKLLAAT